MRKTAQMRRATSAATFHGSSHNGTFSS